MEGSAPFKPVSELLVVQAARATHAFTSSYIPLVNREFDFQTLDKELWGILLGITEKVTDIALDAQLSALKDLNNPPRVCARVINAGEASYHCRDCARDRTCVVCAACFRKSSHANHNYKVLFYWGYIPILYNSQGEYIKMFLCS